jgi:hypothetical protein
MIQIGDSFSLTTKLASRNSDLSGERSRMRAFSKGVEMGTLSPPAVEDWTGYQWNPFLSK